MQSTSAHGAQRTDSAAERPRILLIGYGNTSRRDDGVALHIMERLCRALGLPEAVIDGDGAAEGANPSMIYLHQLAPELAETVAPYDRVVFLDAHVAMEDWGPVEWRPVEPVCRPSMVAHHLKPGVVLALCESLYGHTPLGYTLSVQGHDFDFGEELSSETSLLADRAVAHLRSWLQSELG